METHDLGDERELRFTTSIGGVPTNPSELAFTVREPDGLVTTKVMGADDEVEAVSTGVWRLVWLCRKAGIHHARVVSGGNIVQAAEISFFVRRSKVLEPDDVLPAA